MCGFWQDIGDALSANPKFKPSEYDKQTCVERVWIGLKKIAFANHWSVIYRLSNGKYGITQFDTSGGIDLRDDFNSLESASLETWGGLGNKVRLSCYGSSNENYQRFIRNFFGRKFTYILGLSDCQNFAREVVGYLTGKAVGVWPIEDGPEYGNSNVPSLSEVARDAPLAVPFLVFNPAYWLGKWLFD